MDRIPQGAGRVPFLDTPGPPSIFPLLLTATGAWSSGSPSSGPVWVLCWIPVSAFRVGRFLPLPLVSAGWGWRAGCLCVQCGLAMDGHSLPLGVGQMGAHVSRAVACLSSGHRCRSRVFGRLGLGLECLGVGEVPVLTRATCLHTLCFSYSSAGSSPPSPSLWWGSGAREGGCS